MDSWREFSDSSHRAKRQWILIHWTGCTQDTSNSKAVASKWGSQEVRNSIHRQQCLHLGQTCYQSGQIHQPKNSVQTGQEWDPFEVWVQWEKGNGIKRKKSKRHLFQMPEKEWRRYRGDNTFVAFCTEHLSILPGQVDVKTVMSPMRSSIKCKLLVWLRQSSYR